MVARFHCVTTPSFRFVTVALLVVLVSMLAACNSVGVSTPVANPMISIGKMHTENMEVDLETVSQNNCGGTAEADNAIERAHTVVQTLDVAGEFQVNAGGAINILGTGVELGAAVAGKLGKSYGTTEEIKRSITVRTAAHSKVDYVVSHQEIWKVGEAMITVGGQDVPVPYRFRSDFQLLLVDSMQLPCPTPTPMPTPTPTPTPTLVPTRAALGPLVPLVIIDQREYEVPLSGPIKVQAKAGSNLIIEIVLRDASAQEIQPGVATYEWRFNPPDPENARRVGNLNGVLYYTVPSGRSGGQLITVDVAAAGFRRVIVIQIITQDAVSIGPAWRQSTLFHASPRGGNNGFLYKPPPPIQQYLVSRRSDVYLG